MLKSLNKFKNAWLLAIFIYALIGCNHNTKTYEILNVGLGNSNCACEIRILNTMHKFDEQMKVNYANAQEWYAKARQVQNSCDSMYDYIQTLKDTIVNGSGGWIDKNGDKQFIHNWTEDKGTLVDDKNFDVPTRLMVKEKRADILRYKIISLRKRLLGYIQNDTDLEAWQDFTSTLSLRIDSPKAYEGQVINWQRYNFERVPVIAAVTILSKFQNDTRVSELQLLEYLYKKVNAVDNNAKKHTH